MLKLTDWVEIDEARLYEPRKQDYLYIFAILPVICLLRMVFEHVGRTIFLSSNVCRKMREVGGKKRAGIPLATKKFEEATWKCAYYAVMATYGLAFISWEPFVTDFFRDYPGVITPKITAYYMIQISYYIWMTVCIIWNDVRMKDFNQMLGHHITTLILLFLSYSWGLTNAGSVLLLLMDLSDPFLELGKIFNYLERESAALCSFICFLVAFLGIRLVVYPILVLYPTIMHTWELGVYMNKVSLYFIVNGFELVLLGLNVYWAVLIVKVLITKLKGGKVKDVRSDDEAE